MNISHLSPILIERLVVGQMAENCYLLGDSDTNETVIVDPGDDAQYIIETIRAKGLTPTAVVATHGHFDHIMAAFEVQQTFGIPFWIHEADVFLLTRMRESAAHFLGITVVEPPPKVDKTIKDADVVCVGRHTFTVMHTPGHTPGSICLHAHESDMLLVGDTIFAHGGVGRTDFQYSRPLDLAASLGVILGLAPETKLLPGHGEETTVAAEKVYHKG